jgi:polysaccharide pyruvyl transferase WcaK-like protein
MVAELLITGYFNKQNTGDDYFELLAKQLFSSNKKYKITIKSIDYIKSNIELFSKKHTHILLFGGETLNEYFLKPLAKIKKFNQNIKIYAISVGLGADPSMIKQYLVMFQYIILRHKDDYNIISKMNISCSYVPDMVFMLYKNGYNKKSVGNNIGLFLSQPKNKNNDNNYNNYIHMINKYVNEGCIVKLFSMCYSNNNSESDLYLNKNILTKLSNNIKRNVILVTKNSFDEHIKTLQYAICERFHSHVLCIIYNIPFTSLANTDKAKKLLKDLELNDINININILKEVYKKILPSVFDFYNKLTSYDLDDLIEYPKHKIRHFFTSDEINKYCDYIYSNINNPSEILIKLFGTSNLDYKWGLEEKINKNILKFDDIKWLFEESVLYFNYLHCKYNTNNITSNNTCIINIDYIDQYDRTNSHRSGWRYILNNVSNKLASFNGMYCDMYIDRTFHWCKEELYKANIIPYKKEWIGFVHHTLYQDESGYNCINLLKNNLFIESLECCKGLIFLSHYLKNNFEKLAEINNIKLPKLFVLYHPTEFVDNKWKYKNWNHNIIQIGSWMRDLNAINELNIPNKKFALIGKEMESKYISYNTTNINININNNVELINYLDNDNYDNILSKYVVFIKLYDASAVNTLIECIVRNTPIIVNKLPAIVEYLGEKYPLYYQDINEVPKLLNIKWYNNKIKKAHKYLKNMNKDHLKIETFITKLSEIVLCEIQNQYN